MSAYIGYQVLQRMDFNQKRSIRATLLEPQRELAAFKPGPLFLARGEKHAFLVDLFNSDPGGPVCVTGPRGSGKTMVVKRALAGRHECMYLDLRATPAPSGDALAVAFVTQAGYLLPPNELLARAIFTGTGSGQALGAELDRAFTLITDVLREEKAKGWAVAMPDGSRRIVPPLLCIDELNASGDGGALLEDPSFWRLVDWVLFLTDNRLAHVVLVTSQTVADTLDAYPGWRARRQVVNVDFPRPSTVRTYLVHTLNPFLVRVLKATPRPLPTPMPPLAPAAAGAAAGGGTDKQLPLRDDVAAGAPLAFPLLSPPWWHRFFFGSGHQGSVAAPVVPTAAAPTAAHSVAASAPAVGIESSAAAGSERGSVSATAAITDAVRPAARVSGGVALDTAVTPPAASAPEGVGGAVNAVAAPAPPPAQQHQQQTEGFDDSHEEDAKLKELGARGAHIAALSEGEGPSALVAAARAAMSESAAAAAPAAKAAPSPALAAPAAAPAGDTAGDAAAAGAARLPASPAPTAAPSACGVPPASEKAVLVLEADGARLQLAPRAPVPQASIAAPADAPSAALLMSPTAGTVSSGGLAPSHAPAQQTPPPRSLDGASPARAPPLPPPPSVAAPSWAAPVSFPPAPPSTGRVHTLEAWEVECIVRTIGGHLKDLDAVVTAVARGKPWSLALERLVTDSADHVEHVFEALLEGADGGVGARSSGGGGPGAAPSPNPSSARRAARSRLLPLSAPPSAREGVPYPLPLWDAGHSPRPDRLAAYARYVRAWSLLETLAEAQYVPRRDLIARIFSGCPHELGLFVEAELISTINVVGAAVTHDDALALDGAPLEFVLPGSYVTAASPRMRAAFRSLVCDPQLQLAARRLRSALHIARLREREALLLRRVSEAAGERSYWASLTAALLVRDTTLRGAVAKELVMLQSAAPLTGVDFLSSGSLEPVTAGGALGGHAGAGQAGAAAGHVGVAAAAEAGGGSAAAVVAEAAAVLARAASAPGSSAGPAASAPGSSAGPAAGPALPVSPHNSAADAAVRHPTPDLPLLGVSHLLAALRTATATLRALEDEVTELRAQLAAVRTEVASAEADADALLLQMHSGTGGRVFADLTQPPQQQRQETAPSASPTSVAPSVVSVASDGRVQMQPAAGGAGDASATATAASAAASPFAYGQPSPLSAATVPAPSGAAYVYGHSVHDTDTEEDEALVGVRARAGSASGIESSEDEYDGPPRRARPFYATSFSYLAAQQGQQGAPAPGLWVGVASRPGAAPARTPVARAGGLGGVAVPRTAPGIGSTPPPVRQPPPPRSPARPLREGGTGGRRTTGPAGEARGWWL